MKNPIELLIDLGFKYDEALIYISWLKYGSCPVSTLARHAWVKRLAAHNILKKFVIQWLASTTRVKGVTRYEVISVDVLMRLHQEKITQHQSALDSIGEVIADMIDFSLEPSEVRHYAWIAWMKTAYEETLLDEAYIYAFIGASKKKDDEFIAWLYGTYMPRRNTTIKDIKTIFIPESYERYKSKYVLYWRERCPERVTCIQSDILPLKWGMILFGHDKVLLTSYQLQGMSATIQKNKQYHDSMLALFTYIRNKESPHKKSKN